MGRPRAARRARASLFAAARTREEGEEKDKATLPAMPLAEHVVSDYQTTRLSLKAHPMQFLRDHYAARGFVRACDLRDRSADGSASPAWC